MRHILFASCLLACMAPIEKQSSSSVSAETEGSGQVVQDTLSRWERFFVAHPRYISDGFDFPVGPPSARGYYNAQAFGQNAHLGDDWNAVTGGNTDLGDPVFSIAHGIVSQAYDAGGGWGNVIRVVHQHPAFPDGLGESLYAHCDTLLVQVGDSVRRGAQIGTIGTSHGAYLAHLHLEIRAKADLPLGGGYGFDSTGYLNPGRFIKGHRPE